jgi:hypothetical protein
LYLGGQQFQNNYHTFDGIRKRDVAKGGLKVAGALLKVGIRAGGALAGAGYIPGLGSE